jgi:signal transduction histidine kinase
MFQHSQANTGKEEPTDINALAEEYLRLSYNAIRAKDKSFNVILKTDFDETIGNIDIIPQDIGRVLLNLYNNAFYTVNEKNASLHTSGQANSAQKYEPVVSVTTRRIDSKIQISVKDNGNGIPQKLLDKIFQPFFTTKPTGRGTGLGLSLSYDIVKAYGGELRVQSKEGEGAEFVVQIPSV